jgi:hypothetical protein
MSIWNRLERPRWARKGTGRYRPGPGDRVPRSPSIARELKPHKCAGAGWRACQKLACSSLTRTVAACLPMRRQEY